VADRRNPHDEVGGHYLRLVAPNPERRASFFIITRLMGFNDVERWIARLSTYSISRTDLGIRQRIQAGVPALPYSPRPRIAS